MSRMPDFEMPESPEREDAVVDARSAPGVPSTPGAPADARAPAEPEEPEGPAARTHGPSIRALLRRMRVPAIAFLAGVVVTASGATLASVARDADARAAVDALVAGHVADVEAGEAAGALASTLLDETLATSALLLEGVVPSEPPDVTCEEPRMGVAIATVDCTVRIDRRADAARLVLERIDDAWSLTQGLAAPVRLATGPMLVETVGGTPVPDAVARGEQAAWLVPGRYDVTVRTPAQLVVDRLDGLVVSSSGGAVRWASATSEALDADVEAAALAFARACATTSVEGCPVLQQRDPSDAFEVFAVVPRLRADDPHAMTFEVSIRRPIEQPEEFVVVEVRVDFGADLDRYDVTTG